MMRKFYLNLVMGSSLITLLATPANAGGCMNLDTCSDEPNLYQMDLISTPVEVVPPDTAKIVGARLDNHG
jgi:hypothetical protein